MTFKYAYIFPRFKVISRSNTILFNSQRNDVMSLKTELLFLAEYSDEIEFTKCQLYIIYQTY